MTGRELVRRFGFAMAMTGLFILLFALFVMVSYSPGR